MREFAEWADYEGSIYELAHHGWTVEQLRDLGMTEEQISMAEQIYSLCMEVDSLWYELTLGLDT